MPLLDHFHAPLHPTRPWESFHTRWANAIADHLMQLLPRRYITEIFMHFGAQVAADVAELDTLTDPSQEQGNGAASSGGVAVQPWIAPPVTMSLPAVYPDNLEVRVLDQEDGPRLVAVVELVSPSNKKSPDNRRAFAAKSAAYLQRGVGLVVLDVVTSRQANLHNALINLLDLPADYRLGEESWLLANAYRPTRHQEEDRIDVWANPLTLGAPLPTVPLPLKGAWPVPLALEATYTDARQRARI